MAAFAIVILQPTGYQHAAAFAEIRLLLFHSLRALGHEVVLATNRFPEGMSAIVFGAHLISDTFPVELPQGCIIFNTEQLMGDQPTWSQRILGLAEHHQIWDYASANLRFLRQVSGDLGCHRLRLGYLRELERVPDRRNDREGFIFYGSITPLRREILSRIRLSDRLRVQSFFGVYGWHRDHLLARSRAVLNVHSHSVRLLEWPRILTLVANGIPCIALLHPQTVAEDRQLGYVLAADEAEPTPDLEDWFCSPDVLVAHASTVRERLIEEEPQVAFTRQLLDEALACGFVPAPGPAPDPGWKRCADQRDPDVQWYQHVYHFSSFDPRSLVDYHRQEGVFRQYHPDPGFARHFRPPIALPLDSPRAVEPALRCAVVLHIHSELKAHLFFANFGCHLVTRADFFVTTASPIVASVLRSIAMDYGASLEVVLIENRGRDIPSKYIIFNEVLRAYDLCLFSHGKESDLQWFHDHNDLLSGSPGRVNAVLDLFAREADLGLLFPDYLSAYLPNIGWGSMRPQVDQLLARFGLSTAEVALLEFPAGGFFWARPEALGLLQRLDLVMADLPEEPLPLDHTLLHALERMPCLSCEFLGYRWEKLARQPAPLPAPPPRAGDWGSPLPANRLLLAPSDLPPIRKASSPAQLLDVTVPMEDGGIPDLGVCRQILQDATGPIRFVHLHHYDRCGYLALLWREFLKALIEAGFLPFLTSCSGFDADARNFLAEHSIAAVRRPNRGRCIGAFRDTALLCHELICNGVPIEQLILLNDSVLPLAPRSASLDNLRSLLALTEADAPVMAGFTDSYERGAHLQSYALAVNRGLLLDVSWPLFWASLDADLPKVDLVMVGEVGLSTALRSVGVKLRALYPLVGRLMRNPHFSNRIQAYPELVVGRVNPSLFLADLLRAEGFAFVKKLALFALPAGLPLMQACLDGVEPDLLPLIAEDFDRLLIARAMPAEPAGSS